jgi:uncharacterized SAM-binding protein YcdF (DUF218 family)
VKGWLLRSVVALAVWLAGVLCWIWVGPAESEGATADYAIVLGAAVYDDRPSPVFAARIDHAIDLWRQGRVKAIIFTGGRGAGDSLTEAEVGKVRALDRGVPETAIFLETNSRTTMQNLTLAAPERLNIGSGTVLLVSDPLHLRRAMVMAQGLGYDVRPSATEYTRYRSVSTQVPFALRELYFIHHYWLFGE